MPKYLQVNIPESCQESWNEMLPNNQGKHCLSCHKTVVDFTGMTDAELVNFFIKNTGNTCGRFTNDQLQRDLLIPKKKVNWMKYFFQIAIPALFLSIKSDVQAAKTWITKTEQHTLPEKLIQGDTMVVQKNRITGKVVGEKGEAIPYASVIIKGSRIGVACDSSGSFSITVPATAKQLVIAAIGYDIKEVSIATCNFSNPISLKDNRTLGEVFITKSHIHNKSQHAESKSTKKN